MCDEIIYGTPVLALTYNNVQYSCAYISNKCGSYFTKYDDLNKKK